MNILFDTNIILDVMLDRHPFSESASTLFSIVELGKIKGFLCTTTVTTIHCLATKVLGKSQSAKHIKSLINLFAIAMVDKTVIADAIASKFADFEDAVIYQSARLAGVEAIVTRDPKGFKNAELPLFQSG